MCNQKEKEKPTAQWYLTHPTVFEAIEQLDVSEALPVLFFLVFSDFSNFLDCTSLGIFCRHPVLDYSNFTLK